MNTTVLTPWPQQKLSDKEKDEDWHIDHLKHGTQLQYFQNDLIKNDRSNMISNYNLWNGIVNEDDMAKQFNTMNIKNHTMPGEHRNYPIEVSKFERLAGEEAKRRFEWHIKVSNGDATSIKEDKHKNDLFEFVQQTIQADAFSKEEAQRNLEKINKYYNYSYKDIREERGDRILRYLWREQEMALKFNRSFYDVLIGASEVFSCDILGGEPVMDKCDPTMLTTLRSGTSNRIEDSDVILHTTYMPPAMVLDIYKEYLESDDVDYLDGGVSAIKSASNSMNYGTFTSQMPNPPDSTNILSLDGTNPSYYGEFWDMDGNVRVTRMVWKSYRKVYKLKFFDENDDEQNDWVPETYRPNKLKGEEVTELWIPEWREGTQIGENIYVKLQPFPVNIYDMDSLRLKTSPYIGTKYNINNNKPVSLMDRIKPYKFDYNVFQRRLGIAFSKWNPMTELDLAKKPEHWSLDEWFTYAQTHGYLIIDSFAESNKPRFKGQMAGNFNTTGKTLQIDLGNYIQQTIGILNYIERQVALVSGISPEREGQSTSTNTLGGQESLLQNSMFITEQYYNIHDNTKVRVLQNMLEVSKVAWKNRQKKIPYILDDMVMAIDEIDGMDHYETNYNLFISNSSDDSELFRTLKSLIPTALNADKVNLSQVMSLYSKQSITGIRKEIEAAEQQKMDQAIKAQEDQAKAEQQKVETALQIKQAEMDLEKYKIDTEAQTSIRVKELEIYAKKTELDANSNGVPDFVELADLSLREREQLSKKETEDRKLLLEEKIAKIKSETKRTRALRLLVLTEINTILKVRSNAI